MSHRTIVSAALTVLVALAGLHSTASAHHGGAVEWREEQAGPITGVVTEFAFRFPHVQVSVDVEDASGETAQWTLVTRWTPTILRQHGWSRNSLKPGDTVTVSYLPHVEAPTVGSMLSVEVNGESLDLDF